LIVGLVCSPKNESRIDVPPAAGGFGRGGFDGLIPLFSLFVPLTLDFTAANTTLAKEIPDVDPRYLESDAPCTDTEPIFETNLLSLSLSSCFLFQATSCGGCLVVVRMPSPPLKVGPSSEGVCTALGSAPGRELCSRISAAAKGIFDSLRSFSRYPTLVSR